MSQKLIDRSPDLKRLQDDGYEVEIIGGGHLVVHHIPYLNKHSELKYGKIIVSLTMNNDIAIYQKHCSKHVIHFMGEFPCNKDGSEISAIKIGEPNTQLTKEIVMNWLFSNKPQGDYNNHYEQITRYIDIISSPAISFDNTVKVQTYKVIESEESDVFLYVDTNSSRANISHINDNLKNQSIAIIGLGGTGSYILDFIAKTPVSEIHLFDGDTFCQHNAFRSPGAPAKNIFESSLKKVDYFANIYSNMHKGIRPHAENITVENVHLLYQMSYVFICIDNDGARKFIIQALLKMNIPLIDVGIGVISVDNSLIGTVRTTTVTTEKQDHVQTRVPMSSIGDNEYSSNIQIADINALNAVFAIIKWKKLSGFYQDVVKEFHSTYSINDSNLINDECHNT